MIFLSSPCFHLFQPGWISSRKLPSRLKRSHDLHGTDDNQSFINMSKFQVSLG